MDRRTLRLTLVWLASGRKVIRSDFCNVGVTIHLTARCFANHELPATRHKDSRMLLHNPPEEILDGFWMLGTAPYPLYLYRGTQTGTLFEGGTGSMGPVLRNQLQSLGIAGDYVRQAVVTHAHPDHVMAIPMIRELFPHVAILASAPAAKTLGAEKATLVLCQDRRSADHVPPGQWSGDGASPALHFPSDSLRSRPRGAGRGVDSGGRGSRVPGARDARP